MFFIYYFEMQFIANIRQKLIKMFKMSETTIPLVVIMGATGCAKTKLSIEIAKQFNGEIISADSMQVYKGLDIITNKATHDERQLIPHHLIDFVDPLSRFTATDYSNRALKVIDELMSRRKVPILVGGTNYYIESILWEILIKTDQQLDDNCLVMDCELETNNCIQLTEDCLTKDNVFSEPIYSNSFPHISSHKLHAILEQLDPKHALIIHPNDRRKVVRSLQIYQQNNRSRSEVINEQKSAKGGSEFGGPLRFDHSVILWVDSDINVLNQRLDKRVDEMIEKGLIDELLDFHYRYNKQRITENLSADYSKGIFQSIGFKEFHNYLLLTEEQRKSPITSQLLTKGIDDLKIVTKRYVKHQLKWIRNRFLVLNDRKVPNIYRLNTTDEQLWREEVLEPSVAIVSAYINNTSVSSHILPVPRIRMPPNSGQQIHCYDCNKLLSGLIGYERHINSKGHKYQLNIKKQKYCQLLSILKSHEKRLTNDRRNSV